MDALQREREIDHVHPDQEDGSTHDRIGDDTAQRVRKPVERRMARIREIAGDVRDRGDIRGQRAGVIPEAIF